MCDGEGAVDPPVVAGEEATPELLQPDQRHAVGLQQGDPVLRCPTKVNPVEAEAALEGYLLVGVCMGVPRVAALLRRSQLLPQVTDGAGNPHCRHLEEEGGGHQE